MGGKGKKRREKNYLAAHGGPSRLPPPPDPSQVDRLPSKLRTLMSFTSTSPDGPAKVSKDTKEKDKKGEGDAAKFVLSDPNKSEAFVRNDGGDDGLVMSPNHESSGDEIVQNNADEKRKKKRKRKQVKDLRFVKEMEESEAGSKRRERKKKYWEAKKKKNKKAKTEENVDFPGHEKIRFGEVVEAPPKLVSIPKAPKTVQDASKQRLRLQAIDAYRNRKGWTSRPGLQFPPPMTT